MAGHFREEAFHALRVPECGRRRVRNNNFATCLETYAFPPFSFPSSSLLFLSFRRFPTFSFFLLFLFTLPSCFTLSCFFFFFFFVIFFFHGRLVKSLVSPRWFTETRRRIDLWFQRDSCARIIFESTVDRCEWKICARWKVCAFDGCSGKRSIWMFDENGGVEKGECLVTYVSPTCTARFLVIE